MFSLIVEIDFTSTFAAPVLLMDGGYTPYTHGNVWGVMNVKEVWVNLVL